MREDGGGGESARGIARGGLGGLDGKVGVIASFVNLEEAVRWYS